MNREELIEQALTQSGRFKLINGADARVRFAREVAIAANSLPPLQAEALRDEARKELAIVDLYNRVLAETSDEYFSDYMRDVRPRSPGHSEMEPGEMVVPTR